MSDYGKLPDGKVLERKWWYDWFFDQTSATVEITVKIGEQQHVRSAQVDISDLVLGGSVKSGLELEDAISYQAAKRSKECFRSIAHRLFLEEHPDLRFGTEPRATPRMDVSGAPDLPPS